MSIGGGQVSFSVPKRHGGGFTLVELLIVVGIIGLLAAIAVTGYDSVRKKSKISKTQTDLSQFSKMIQTAQISSGRRLALITGSYYTMGPCATGDLRGIAESSTCAVNTKAAFNAIAAAAGYPSFPLVPRDGWGSPYLINENEGEGGNCTLSDNVFSAGPDGTMGGGDDISMSLIPQSGACP